jgi:hypothetical protein
VYLRYSLLYKGELTLRRSGWLEGVFYVDDPGRAADDEYPYHVEA